MYKGKMKGGPLDGKTLPLGNSAPSYLAADDNGDYWPLDNPDEPGENVTAYALVKAPGQDPDKPADPNKDTTATYLTIDQAEKDGLLTGRWTRN